MSLNIYDFSDFDGIAKTEDQGNYELRIYFRGKTNVECAIITKHQDTYNLYNFICDKQHMKNMYDCNWFHPITEIELSLTKITPFIKDFINYALKHKVTVKIESKPF